jgi:hypothetical protein
MTIDNIAIASEPAIDAEWLVLSRKIVQTQQTVDFYSGKGATSFRAEEKLEAARAQLAGLKAEEIPFAEEWKRRGGWPRYYLVTNSNGHIHSTTWCHTCNARTQFAWLTELSGSSAAACVADYGSQLCTVCFPGAPVEYTDGSNLGRLAIEAKALRDLEKAQRNAEKFAKSLTGDGTEYRFTEEDGNVERFKTIVAARNYAINELRNHRYYGQYTTPDRKGFGDHYKRNAERIIEVIAARTGESVEDLTAKYTKTAAKG